MPLRVILFKSRNKDNKEVKGFKERVHVFLTDKEDISELSPAFDKFVLDGVAGEMSRFYVSINSRNPEIIKKILIKKILFDNISILDMNTITCSVADLAECASEKRWLFDFDDDNYEAAKHFIEKVKEYGNFADNEVELHDTPNGYAVIVAHGFDTRKLLAEFPNVTLKRDDKLCYDWNFKVEL